MQSYSKIGQSALFLLVLEEQFKVNDFVLLLKVATFPSL